MPWKLPEEAAAGDCTEPVGKYRARAIALRRKIDDKAASYGWPTGLPVEFYRAATENGVYMVVLEDGQKYVFQSLDFNGCDFVLLTSAMHPDDIPKDSAETQDRDPPTVDISVRISMVVSIIDISKLDSDD